MIRSETQEYVGPVDSTMMLECQADGSPPPSVTWHKNGLLLSDSVRQRVLSSGSLQIAFIQPSDAGQYTCTAANAAGTASLEMSLTVQSRFQLDLQSKPHHSFSSVILIKPHSFIPSPHFRDETTLLMLEYMEYAIVYSLKLGFLYPFYFIVRTSDNI